MTYFSSLYILQEIPLRIILNLLGFSCGFIYRSCRSKILISYVFLNFYSFIYFVGVDFNLILSLFGRRFNILKEGWNLSSANIFADIFLNFLQESIDNISKRVLSWSLKVKILSFGHGIKENTII